MTAHSRIRKKEYLWLLVIVLLASLPLLFPGIEGRTGQDLQFHLNRIEGIATELKAGHIFNRMSAYWLNGYGYPVSVFYGDLLLYIPAALRVCGVSVLAAYKIFMLLVHAATVLISYVCLGKIFREKKVALLCTAAYTLSAYRYLDLYVRAAVGEYCAMVFLPVLAVGMWKLYADREVSSGSYRYLAIGMTGLIGTHLISAQMAVLTMGVMAVALAKKTFAKSRLYEWLKAIGLSVLLNLYFLVPFIDYYWNEDVYIKARMEKTQMIGEDGAYLWQFVAFLQNPFGTIISNHEDIMAFHPGILLMGALFAAVLLRVRGCAQKKPIRFLTISALFLIWISSSLFPWNAVENIPYIGKFLIGVQFPWRYVSILCVALTLLLGLLTEQYVANKEDEETEECTGRRKAITGSILAALLFTTGFFTVEYALHYEPVYYQTAEDLDSADVGYFEYLRTGTKKDELTGEVTYDGDGAIAIIERNGTDMTLEITGKDTAEEIKETEETVTVTIPILNYRGYRVYDNLSRLYAIHDGDQNQIRIELPYDYTGRLYVEYEQPALWTLAEWISFATLIWLVWAILSRKKAAADKR